jgi:hypothetical protein
MTIYNMTPTSVDEGAESPLLLRLRLPCVTQPLLPSTELAARVTSVTPALPLACLDADGAGSKP